MSSAFPTPEQPDAFSPAAVAIPIEDRGVHIPAFYVRNPHRNPKLVVTQDGLPLLGMDKKPFTIAQVAPERRWAVLEDGNVMNQTDFDAAKKKGVFEYYEMLRARGNPDAKYSGKIDCEPIPAAAEYVAWRVDPEDATKLLQIGFDPNATDGARAKQFHTREGEAIEATRLDVLCQAFATEAGRKQMTDAEIAEVEAHVGVRASAGGDGVAAKLEMLTDLKNAGSLSDEAYIDAVSKLTGAGGTVTPIRPEPDPKPEESSEPEEVDPLPEAASSAAAPAENDEVVPLAGRADPNTASCGKAGLKGDTGVAAHERRCTKCRELHGLDPWKKGAGK